MVSIDFGQKCKVLLFKTNANGICPNWVLFPINHSIELSFWKNAFTLFCILQMYGNLSIDYTGKGGGEMGDIYYIVQLFGLYTTFIPKYFVRAQEN